APGDPAIETAWGELFLLTEQNDEALKSFQAVLKIDPRWTPALVGAARALADNPPQAAAFAKRALEVNPSSVEAYVLLAEHAASADRRADARELLAKALAVNPSSPDAHAQLAALAYVDDREEEYQAEVTKALAVAPRSGEVYRTAGQLAAQNYRFDEAVALTRRALALEPDNPRALAELGTHLLRTGDEPGARAALDRAFALHPYSVVTLNSLRMMDTLDTFETITDGDLIFRMSKDEAPVLREYIIPLAHRALDGYRARYEFAPRGPILIEVFTKHDDFAVRNVGLPGMVGALGACFGRVVTMDSPRAMPPGSFQWESVLWHELAHVITIQMSNQRITRWLTEGISAFEEKRARPEWARPQEIEFAERLNHGRAIKLRDLNSAFSDARTISFAYFQAALLVEHLDQIYGAAGINKLVRAYGTGMDTDAALSRALDTDFDRLQTTFDTFTERLFGELRRALADTPGGDDLKSLSVPALRAYAEEHPGSYDAQMTLASALRKDHPDEAMRAYERAARLVPIARGGDSPHAVMATLALERHDRARAIAELHALVAVDADNLDAARRLAALLREAGIVAPATLQPVYARIAAIDPFDAEAHRMLGRLAMQGNDPELAAREFRAVVALKPVDRAAAYTDLAESYAKAGKKAEAKKATLAALEIAPSDERAQALLLTLVDSRP
ncbi:MAG: tetratricopeptide repeat protein, partial [Acidobacteriota bacterium]